MMTLKYMLAMMHLMIRRVNTRERPHRNLQRTHWYSLTGPTDIIPPGMIYMRNLKEHSTKAGHWTTFKFKV